MIRCDHLTTGCVNAHGNERLRTFDDFECPFPDFLQPLFELVARIAAISEDMKQPRPLVFDGFQEIGSAVAILNIGAVHHEADHQPERVDNDVALAALNRTPLFTGCRCVDGSVKAFAG
jgi:hypothetical protein